MAISIGTQSPLRPSQADLYNQAPALELAQEENKTTSKFDDQQCKVTQRDAALRITESPQEEGAEELDNAYEPASCSEGYAEMGGEMGHQQQHRF